ncbi:MAG: hypothetical protein ACFFBP_17135, partial [Promethearchaeota archaeon]
MDPFNIYYGILALVVTIFTVILGLNMILKYYKYKVLNFIFFGISLIGLSARNWPIIGNSIFLYISTNPISTEWYFILGYGHSLGLISWMIGWTLMVEMKQNHKRLILISFSSFEIIYLSLFYINLFLNLSFVGNYDPVLKEFNSGLLVRIHTYVMIILLIITLSKLFLDTRKTNNKEIRLKGTFIIIGMLSLLIGGIINLLIKHDLVYSISLIFCVCFIYFGTVFPNWIKKI